MMIIFFIVFTFSPHSNTTIIAWFEQKEMKNKWQIDINF